ncbi:hypothetical protein FRC09_008231 [Ceratobasidium sp. 395]|nr:hypothetical protein FRC09_008231 [Ceratobasidium sp. 395]
MSLDLDHYHVEPVSFMDAHSGGAHLMLTVAVTFSGVLDEERVRGAASALARRWPMLGCRVRRVSDDIPSFELLVPEAEYAVLNTTVSHIPQPLESTTSLPQRTSTISTQLLTRNTALYHPPSSTPPHTSAYTYIPSTSPQPGFTLHVSILSDATVLSLTFPHVLMDACGAGCVLRGLVGVMEGEEVGGLVEGDPWEGVLAESRKDREVQVEGWTTYGPDEFGIAAEAEQRDLEADGPISQRTIYFPKGEVEKMKVQAMDELRELGLEGDVPYLSSGDVIVAWLYKQFYGDEIHDPTRPSRLLYILDTRSRLPSHFSPSQTYLKNAYIVAPAPLIPNSKVRDMKLGELARMVRLLVEDSAREESVRSFIKWKWDTAVGEGMGRVQVPAGAGERVMFASNWLTFGLGDLNIQSLIRPSSGTGQVLDVYCGLPGIPRCSGVITYRDTSGGIVAQFDWAEKNWTSGSVGAYALERAGMEKEKEKEEKEKVEVEGGKEMDVDVESQEEKGVRRWGVYAFVSWIWRWLRI